MERKRPWKIGLVRGRNDFPQEQVQIHERRLSATTDLRDLTEHYTFYSPALLYLKVRLMGRDPYINFLQEYGREIVPFSLRMNKAVFRGMDSGTEVSWNYCLYGLEQEHFEAYRGWLGTLTFADRELDLVVRVRYKKIEIADPLYFEKVVILPDEIPLVPVTVVCLETNKGSWYVETGPFPLVDLPAVRFTEEVKPEMAAFAAAVLQGHPDPYQAADRQASEKDIAARVRQARKGEDS